MVVALGRRRPPAVARFEAGPFQDAGAGRSILVWVRFGARWVADDIVPG